MKTLATACLLIVLSCAVPPREVGSQTTGQIGMKTQEVPWRGKSPRYPGLHSGPRERRPSNLLHKPPFGDRRHEFQRIDPADPFGILTERRMHSSGPIERFVDRESDLHPDHFSKPTQPYSNEDSVQIAWVSHYASGLLPGDDEATAIAVDNSGNVYVTGYSGSLPLD